MIRKKTNRAFGIMSKKRVMDLTRDQESHALELYRNSIVLNCLDACKFDGEYLRIIRDSGINSTAMGIEDGFENIADIRKLIEENSEIAFGPVTSVKEIRRAKEMKKVAVFFNSQTSTRIAPASPLRGWSQPNFDLLPLYHKLGLRILMPTYNNRNMFAEGCGERTNAGLSQYGVELVEWMNKLNILCDCSHMGIQDTLDVAKYAKFPVATHSNARAVCDNVRNRTDEEIKAIAEKDGVLGIVTFPSFVKWTKMEKGEKPSIEDVLDHVDYMANLVGIEHVGFGFDFIDASAGLDDRAKRLRPDHSFMVARPDIWGKPVPSGYWEYAEGIDEIRKTSNMSKGMVARGYSDKEIKGVLGENWLRLFEKAWG